MMKNTIVRHILVCKFVPQMTAEQFAEFIARFSALKEKIEGIISFEYGANNSPEGKDLGMTHVITLTFVDTAARDAYLPHPEHVKFGQWLGEAGIFKDLIVVDYVPQESDLV
jgi:hypothetical protein